MKSVSINSQRIFIAGWLLLVAFSSKGQAKADSVTYWINTRYNACLDSGKSVCHCQEQNGYLILYLDTVENSLLIRPSIYAGMEMIQCDIRPGNKSKTFFTVAPGFELDSTTTIRIKGALLTLTGPGHIDTFTKTNIKATNDKVHLDSNDLSPSVSVKFTAYENLPYYDMSDYIQTYNCKPLLNYSIKPRKGSSVFLTRKEIAGYIADRRISISCSDDFHYSEMTIKKTDSTYSDYFMVYKQDTIELYKEPERDRGESVDVTKLKDCEILYKKK